MKQKLTLIAILMMFTILFAPLVSAGAAPSKPDVIPNNIDILNGSSKLFYFRSYDSDSNVIKFEIEWISDPPAPFITREWTGWVEEGLYTSVSHTWNIDEDILAAAYGGSISYGCAVRAYDGNSYSRSKSFYVTVESPPPPPPGPDPPPPSPPDPTPPCASITNIVASPTTYTAGSSNTITATVKNTGDLGGNIDCAVTDADTGIDYDSETIYIAAYATKTFTFSVISYQESNLNLKIYAGYSNYDDIKSITLSYNAPDPPPPPPPPPVTVSIYVYHTYPSTINPGDTTLLYWISTNANTVSIDQGIGSVATEGYEQVSPTQTTTYIISATGEAGTVTDSTTVTVIDPSPPLPPDPDPDPPPDEEENESIIPGIDDILPTNGQFNPNIQWHYIIIALTVAVIAIKLVNYRLKNGRWPFQKKKTSANDGLASFDSEDYDIQVEYQ